MTSLGQIAVEMYEAGAKAELIHLAIEKWPIDGGSVLPGTSELCRFASIAAWDLFTSKTEDLDPAQKALRAGQVEFLRARASVSAVLLNERVTVAGMLLPPFFSLVDRGHFDLARSVLAEIRRVLPEHFDEKNLGVFARILSEKRGYSFLREGEYEIAIDEYSTALELSRVGSRGRLKVRGALALCRYLLTPADNETAAACIDELTDVRSAALAGDFPDVRDAANANIELIRRRATAPWTAFEVE